MDTLQQTSTPASQRPDPSSNRLMDLLLLGSEYLAAKGVENSRLDAELLLGHLLQLDRVGLYLQYDRPLTDDQKTSFRALLVRRSKGEPLQYINGHAGFRNLDLIVRPGVLIPRSETELLIDHAAKHAPEGGFEHAADLGTGSGAIALSLLKEGIAREVVAVDYSAEALTVATENARSMGFIESSREEGVLRLTKRNGEDQRHLTLVKRDVFSGAADLPGAPFPLIVSNPPYVSESEFSSLAPNVRDHEPRSALVSGPDGLDAHRALSRMLANWLTPGGLFLGEIGANQGVAVCLLHESWSSRVTLHKDYANLDRIVEARRS
ncbi:MAG: peptide chain release factor N(5)-glutamine methyltransferase [bacterium]